MKKTKQVPLLLFLLLNFHIAFSQLQIQSNKSYGGTNEDYLYSLSPTANGGYVLLGWSDSDDIIVTGNHGLRDFWLINVKANGKIKKKKCYGGSNNDEGASVKQTTDGGFILAGASNSNNGNVKNNHGDYDVWVVKTRPNGKIQWQQSYGGSGADYAYDIHQTNDGGYIIVGVTFSGDGDVSGGNYHGGGDYWVIKTNASGNILWQKCFGGTGEDYSWSVEPVNGKYIVGGWSNSTDGDVTGNHGGFDYWAVEIDNAGNLNWQQCFGGSGEDRGYDIKNTSDGGYAMSGWSNSTDGDVTGNHGDMDYWIIKMTATAIIQWQKSYGGSSEDVANRLIQTSSGGYAITGYTQSSDGDITGFHGSIDGWVIQLDSAGNLLDKIALGGSSQDFSTGIIPRPGGFMVSNLAYSNDGDVTSTNYGNGDYWVVKLGSPLAKPSFENLYESISSSPSILPYYDGVTIYPNPTSGILNLEFDYDPGNTKIEIRDMQGRIIISQEANNELLQQMDLAILKSGIYLVQISSSGKFQSIKFVKD